MVAFGVSEGGPTSASENRGKTIVSGAFGPFPNEPRGRGPLQRQCHPPARILASFTAQDAAVEHMLPAPSRIVVACGDPSPNLFICIVQRSIAVRLMVAPARSARHTDSERPSQCEDEYRAEFDQRCFEHGQRERERHYAQHA